MRINRELLLHKLQQVSPGLATREILEQSAAFVFSDGKISTFNDEILCITELDCDITGAVHAKPLVNLLSKLSDDEVDITSNQEELVISAKRSRAGIRMEAEILLPVETVEEVDEGSWVSIPDNFSEALGVVFGSTSKDDSHFSLTCVHLASKFVEACDGFQMTRYKIKTGLSADCLIRRDSAKFLSGLSVNKLSEGKNWIHFAGSDIRISFRRWVQEYLDLSDLLKFSGTPATLPKGLSEAVDKAEIFSADSQAENQVLVEIKQGKLRLKGEGAHGWYEERKRIEYDGDPLSFLIPPRLLLEITKRTNDCEISSDRLKINAGKFIFVACLGVREQKEDTEE